MVGAAVKAGWGGACANACVCGCVWLYVAVPALDGYAVGGAHLALCLARHSRTHSAYPTLPYRVPSLPLLACTTCETETYVAAFQCHLPRFPHHVS